MLYRPCWIDHPLPANAQVFLSIARFLQQYGARAGRERFGQSEQYQDMARSWPYVAGSLLNLFDDARAEEAAIKFERIARDAPVRRLADLAAIRLPTLVLANRDDPVHPFEYGTILAKAIAGAKFVKSPPSR